MAVPSLFSWLTTLRQVDARRRRDALHDAVVASRGDEESVRSVSSALAQAADPTPQRRAGLRELEQWLGGGG
jgi:hypothetical protein